MLLVNKVSIFRQECIWDACTLNAQHGSGIADLSSSFFCCGPQCIINMICWRCGAELEQFILKSGMLLQMTSLLFILYNSYCVEARGCILCVIWPNNLARWNSITYSSLAYQIFFIDCISSRRGCTALALYSLISAMHAKGRHGATSKKKGVLVLAMLAIEIKGIQAANWHILQELKNRSAHLTCK